MEKHKKSAATKKHIMNVALELFSEKDFNGTSVDEITAKASITKGALYYHFKNKNDLFMEVCQMTMESYQMEVLDKSTSSDPSGSSVRLLIINSHRFDLEHPRYSRLYLRIMGEDWSRNEEVYPIFKKYYEVYREQVRKLILEDIVSGIAQPTDVESATTLLMALLDGMSIHSTIYSHHLVEEIDIEAIADTVLRGFQ
jgi:AcrR family transcriptional regulator